MTPSSLTTIPLDAESPAQRLRRTAAAVRVMLHWWGVHRALTPQQKEEIGSAASADARFLTAGKKLIDMRHEAFRQPDRASRPASATTGAASPCPTSSPACGSSASRTSSRSSTRWRASATNCARPRPTSTPSTTRSRPTPARRLGRLYNPADYPAGVRELFGVEWDFPSVEPPSYLMRVAPEVYERGAAARGRPLRRGGAAGRAGLRRGVRPARWPTSPSGWPTARTASGRSSATRPSTT